jgi:Domain of unknown function (DUF3806)
MGWLRKRRDEGDGSERGQQIEAPNDSEKAWVETNLGLARELVSASGGRAPDSGSPAPAALDAAFAAWFGQWHVGSAEGDDPNVFINAFGIAFGQRLIDDLALRWAVVTDADGTELAVHGQPGDLLVFPANAVAKRFTAGETGFFEPLYDGIRSEVERLRSGLS